jgi:hypothetical protein
MLKPVKILAVFTFLVLLSSKVNAQLKLPSLSPAVNDVKRIIQEFPNGFSNITGALIKENEQSVDYECTMAVNGAADSYITHYPTKKNIYSWQAVMYTTEDFAKAKQKYKWLFNQFNNLPVKLGSSAYKLSGNYEVPSEQIKFTSCLFKFSGVEDDMKKTVLELTMQYYAPMEWKIKLLVYNKEREDHERGEVKEQ